MSDKLITIPEMEEYLHKDMKQCNPEDIIFYENAVRGLPSNYGSPGKDGIPVPYGSARFTVQHFHTAMLATRRPIHKLKVLEIGFNLGYGAAIMLDLGCMAVHAIDISRREETINAAEMLRIRYGTTRFDFMVGSAPTAEKDIAKGVYDMCHIDGDHEGDSVNKDIALCAALRIPWLLFDDWWPTWGPAVQPAVIANNLHVVAVIGNKGLCRWNDKSVDGA